MKLLSLISDHLLLCVFLSLLWGTTDSTTTTTTTKATTVTARQSAAKTETTTRTTTNLVTATTQKTTSKAKTIQKNTPLAPTTQKFTPLDPKVENSILLAQTNPTLLTSTEQTTAATTTKASPDNVNRVNVTTQNESSITLTWNKVSNIPTYILQYGDITEGISNTEEGPIVHVVTSLTAGTNYTFILFTTFDGLNSSGYRFSAVTVPPVVPWVSVTERFTNNITLEWENMNKAWQYQLQINGHVSDNVSGSSSGTIRKVVTSLQPGTEYDFSLTTVFAGLRSTPYMNFTVTAIDCASADWKVTNTSIKAKIEGLFSKATAHYGSKVYVSDGHENVSFTGLYPGATYQISLVYERSSRVFLQCEHKLTILPPNLNAHCEYWAAGYSVLIKWTDPEGEWTNVEVNVTGKTHTVASPETKIIIDGFQPAKKFKVSVTSLSGLRRSSEPHVFYCQTDPRGSFVLRLFRHLVVFSPYCFSTGLLLSIYWSRKTANKPDVSMEMTKCDGGGDELYEDYDDVTVLGTEHDF
ncbi:unnamed protein product [Oreochromis niloticus]|nr:unnamed protein product [Mustela putorius furo]